MDIWKEQKIQELPASSTELARVNLNLSWCKQVKQDLPTFKFSETQIHDRETLEKE